MSKLKVDQISKASGASPATFTLPATDGSAGQYLKTDGSGALSWGTPPDQKITSASSWGQTAFQTGSKNPITDDLALRTTAGQGNLGDAMTLNTGVFTFPSTGYWQVIAMFVFNRAAGDSLAMGTIKSTTNNGGAWTDVAAAYQPLISTGTYGTTSCTALLHITDTSNNKVSFRTSHDNASNTTAGGSDGTYTSFTFIRLADI